jgi:hypothetical protein
MRHAFFIRITLWLRVVRALLFIKWGWVDWVIRLVFLLLSSRLSSLLFDILLRLYGLRRDVLFPLISWVRSKLCCLGELHIELTIWCMNVENYSGACARAESRCCWCGLTWDGWKMSGHDRRHWKASSSTHHYLREISRVWPDRRWWGNASKSGLCGYW